jgi:tRNA threonylcarbamoyladenosine modification (KEOPS) complex Cgi121 subunit
MEGESLVLEVRCYLIPADQDAVALKKVVAMSLPSLLVQAVGYGVAQNERLVELVAWQTWAAKSSDSLLAKTPEMDLLLRLSGTTQISDAIRDAGVRKGQDNVLILAGTTGDLLRFRTSHPSIRERLAKREPTRDEMERLEKAAMLSASRARSPASASPR